MLAPLDGRAKPAGAVCVVAACKHHAMSRGLCRLHYYQAHHGQAFRDADAGMRPSVVRVDGAVAYVELLDGRGRLRGEAIIDAADVSLVAGYRWYHHGRYVASENGGVTLLLHRFLLAPPEEMEVDHVDGNGLDNRRANLRPATRAQNLMNMHSRVRSNTGERNVTRTKRGRFVVQVRHRHVGLFATLQEAVVARDAHLESLGTWN